MKPLPLFDISVHVREEANPDRPRGSPAIIRIVTVQGQARGVTGGAAVRNFVSDNRLPADSGFSFTLVKE